MCCMAPRLVLVLVLEVERSEGEDEDENEQIPACAILLTTPSPELRRRVENGMILRWDAKRGGALERTAPFHIRNRATGS